MPGIKAVTYKFIFIISVYFDMVYFNVFMMMAVSDKYIKIINGNKIIYVHKLC